jgi:hypothetical protein
MMKNDEVQISLYLWLVLLGLFHAAAVSLLLVVVPFSALCCRIAQ